MAGSNTDNLRNPDDPFWYKDAVIYQLHVKSFFDANDDGVGDFAGLIQKLDYIASLGVDTVWLLPFYPSPRRDDGYDIANYRGVHPDYGTLADVRRFIRAAHARGLRVITELVVNHTSDQHPWFQRARRARPGSAARNFYVWSDDDQRYAGTRIIFLDTEKSNWTWDPVAGAYFWHRFYSHQPDLNYDNPRVLKEVLAVMHFWLDLGVDGLRLDAVPYLVERDGTHNENLPETHDILRRIRADLDASYDHRMLLAEANQWPEDAQEYFGRGDECHMCFHFPLMPRMYMAIASEDRYPITDIMRQTPDIPDNCQWAVFLRNHDELTLEMVTSSERDYLWNVYAADRRARINLGIRRRLAPLLERDRRRIELMNSLLLSMPGTPVIYYGDELGMGDNIHLGDRDGVRTPMQWSPDRNGGFSRADPERLPLPPLLGPLYGYETINVEAQQRDPHSLLNWTRRMLDKRRQTRAFGRGSLRFLYPGNRKILAYLREYEGSAILCVANLSRSHQPVELDLSEMAGRVPVEMLGDSSFPTIGQLPYLLTLPPYGFYWFELSATAAPPAWHAAFPEQMTGYATLVLRGRAGYQLTEGSLRALRKEVLPHYLARQRWFARRQAQRISADPVYAVPLPGAAQECFLAEIQADPGSGEPTNHFLPLALIWSETLPPAMQPYAMARVRRGPEVGMAVDAFGVEACARAMLDHMRRGTTLNMSGALAGASLRFLPEPALAGLDLPGDAPIEWPMGEQSNSSLIIGSAVVLKFVRRVADGIHPEAEMSRKLSRAGYANTAPLLGELVRMDADGTPHTLALLHGYVANQGDAWGWSLQYLKSWLDEAALPSEPAPDEKDALLGYEALAAAIGRRLAQFHDTVAQATDDPDFAPEVARAAQAKRWGADVMRMLDQAVQALARQDDAALAGRGRWLAGHRDVLAQAVAERAARLRGTQLLRIHGDFHLGQVLVSQGDAYLIDFEGEPARPLAERRAHACPTRDVAGLLRSFDYAAAAAAGAGAPVRETPAEPAMPAEQAQQQRRERLLARFRRSAGRAFLDAYHEQALRDGARWLDEEAFAPLLELAMLEKAAYEVCYEAAHRPTWMAVPAGALCALASQVLGLDRTDEQP